MSTRSTLVSIAAGTAALAAFLAFAAPSPQAAQGEHPAPEFQGIDTWLNSEPLSMAKLHGQVVLVDFWTFDCVNCRNTLPHVESWHEKYKDKGLVVVGVHTPEYAFERPTENVKRAIEKLKVGYAVAQDNSYATWRAYGNQYWPAVYLIDKQGRIVYSHFGEGRYAEIEKKINELLAQEPAGS
jgi:thiol-disulfide isomerase/thioredoxin